MSEASSYPFPRRFMAIDNGSNAIKFRLWQVGGPDDIEKIAERRFPLRLGEGVFGGGRITPEKINAAADLYQDIRRDMERLGVTDYRAVGTSALREAANTDDLIQAVESASGIRIEVIGDDEEAHLIALGAIGQPEGLTGRHVMIDVGGGSTEIILTRDRDIEWARSLPIGAVRLTGRFFTHLPPDTAQYDATVRILKTDLDRELAGMPSASDARALGSGGTMVALLLMIYQQTDLAEIFTNPTRQLIKRARLTELVEDLRHMTTDDIVATYHADARRAEIILAGALIMLTLLERLGLDAIELGRGGVSDGLLWDWLTGFGPE